MAYRPSHRIMVINICGIPHTVTIVNDPLLVQHSRNGASLWGELCCSEHSINILASSPQRELRTFLHEVLHGIIQGNGVRELVDKDGDHIEAAIDQISNGYADVLESIGFELRPKKKVSKMDKLKI